MPAIGKSSEVTLGFRHTGIVVRNVDAALDFYRGFLGLELVKDYVEEGPFIERLTAVPQARIRIAKLQAPIGGIIELLQYLTPEPKSVNLSQHQISHVAFTVNNVDQLYREGTGKGVRFNYAPQLSPDGYAKVAYCHDPDGTVVELVELANL